ncbi:hypothetical protein FF100_28475 [Methylobacterium terricola]|uniref:Uncharacterized protein n=1 Tax=Methylobacterium terricola TaxID=2583531 RepID=A0A5C4L8P9_9HYPH|nr:hypothetical protein [Methylobacterium terricola]TNC08776.1 hypothetical protein FF100_28475 [Methylobacterium terricola]
MNEIAGVLGVSVDTFSATAQLHVLHTGEDGERWLLELDGQGTPTIRLDSPAAEQGTPGESVQAFLAREVGSPQHQALAALIDRLLTGHLLFDAG